MTKNTCITKDEFDLIIAEGKMFKVAAGDLFFGTADDWANCFFDNVNYDDVVNFAKKTCGGIVEPYTEEEHALWLKNKAL